MQCFICVAYVIFICSAHPPKPPVQHEKRSLFHDVIESLRIQSQLPETFDQNEENNLNQNYESYGYENEPQLPSDSDFIPRRNDRIEMPALKYRFPKSLDNNETDNDNSKEEIVVFISTTKEPTPPTQKPKKKRPRPTTNRNKTNKNKENEEEVTEDPKPEDYYHSNNMAGQSQIGNRESQMVVKPTVIVNIRGSVNHKDSDIRIEGRTKNETDPGRLQNVFNIKQEVKLDRTFGGMGSSGAKPPEVKQEVKVEEKSGLEEDMMMCETATWNPEKNREGRKFDNVMQIFFSL